MSSFLLTLLFIILLIVYSVTKYLESKYVFRPVKSLKATPSEMNLIYEPVEFISGKDIKLKAWRVSHSQPIGRLLCLQGNGHNKSYRLERLLDFHQQGFDVFIFDYRGYGDSEGFASEKGLYEDACSAYDKYIQMSDAILPLVVYGGSLGGTVAIDLATKRKVDGLIIDSSFTSISDVAKFRYQFLPLIFFRYQFDAGSKVKQIHVPIVFYHSFEDESIPYYLGYKLFEKANMPKAWIKVSGTHDMVRSKADAFKIRKAIDQLILGKM